MTFEQSVWNLYNNNGCDSFAKHNASTTFTSGDFTIADPLPYLQRTCITITTMRCIKFTRTDKISFLTLQHPPLSLKLTRAPHSNISGLRCSLPPCSIVDLPLIGLLCLTCYFSPNQSATLRAHLPRPSDDFPQLIPSYSPLFFVDPMLTQAGSTVNTGSSIV